MRPSLLAAALAAASVMLPAGAHADSICVAHASPPQASGGQVYGEGVFACGSPATGSLVTVCIDLFWMDNPPGWGAHTCSDVRVDDFSQVVVHGVWACVQGGGPLVRTTITGTTEDGVTATASSVPVPAPTGSCGP